MSRYFRKLNLMSSFLCLILLSATFIASAAIEQKWQQVSGGYSFTVAIKSDGSLWAWGYNSSGQLGSGDNVDSDIPQKIGNDTNWQSIAAGDRHVLATKTDGTLWTWGENTFGQLGLNSRTLQFTTPQQVFTDTDWQKVTGGNTHSLAMKSNGTLGAWGSRSSGKLGDGNTSNGLSRFPVQVGSDDNWLNVSASQAHTLAVKTDGTLWAWGDNGNGQLGDGSESDTYNPVQIGTDTNWLDVSAGSFNSLGLKSDGTLWAWGSNFFGALGLGEDTSKRLIPHRIGLDNDWQSMVASFAHVLAIKTDGSLWSWGDNNDGQLGNGTIGDEVFPEQVGSERNWQHVSTSLSSGHSLAIKLDGSLWAWGNNEDGQLGIGNRLETLNRHQVLVKESDVDNDGIVDSEDAFPSIAIGDLMDTDNDGAPDECDTDCQTSGMSADADDDNDDVLDTVDAFPLDATESVDTDLDGIGNNADNDDDNDGLPDTYELANDLNPLDVLDAAQDEDSDGLSNSEEFALGTNINLADSDADGIADNVDTNPLVFDAVNEMLYSGQIAILPDINGDNVQEVGVLQVVPQDNTVILQVLDGINQQALSQLTWSDIYEDTTLTLHVVEDINGIAEVGLFGVRDSANNEGKPQMFVRDLQTGARVSVINWPANWREVSALVLPDMTGDGLAEIGLEGRFKDGYRPQLVVKNGLTNGVVATFSYPNLLEGPQFYAHSDVSGDGVAEIATFGRISRNNKIQIKIASGVDAQDKLKSYNFPDKWSDVSWHRLDDSNGDGEDDWGLFGINNADGRAQLIVKDGTDPKGALRIHAWPSELQNVTFLVVPDMNDDGVNEVAVAGIRSNNGRYQVQVQNGMDRNNVLANHNLSLPLNNVEFHVLPDLSGDGVAEIGFLGLNETGEYELVIRHGDTSLGALRTDNLGANWAQKPSITSLGDTDNDELMNLLIYGQDNSSEALRIENH